MSVLANVCRKESLGLLDLNGVKLTVMRALDACGGKFLTRSELSKNTGLRISTLCGALKRLENEGWVRIAFDTLDTETNRRVSVYTTSEWADYRILNAAGIVREHWQGA